MSASIQAEDVDPLNIPLPADIHFGTMLFNQGTSLRAFVQAMQQWRLRVQQQDILLAQAAPDDGDRHAPLPGRALRMAGMSAYHEGLGCDPPSFFDGEEQREWAIGWINGLKAVWRVP